MMFLGEGMHDGYTERNVIDWFVRLDDLVLAKSTSQAAFDEFLSEWIEHANKKRRQGKPRAKGFKSTTYYAIREDKRGILRRISPEAFEAIQVFVRKFDSAGPADVKLLAPRPDAAQESDFYSQVATFLRSTPETCAEACQQLPGLYRTYRPSLSKPGWLVVGQLEISATSGARLSTREETVYRTDKEAAVHTQIWQGHIWYANELCLLFASDKSAFPRLSVLTVQDRDHLQRVLTLRGSYSGHSTLPGRGIISSRIYMLRLDESEVTALKGRTDMVSLGHKHVKASREKDRISKDIWDRVFPPKGDPILSY